MTGNVAHLKKVRVSDTSGGTFVALPISSADLSLSSDVLDDTELSTNDAIEYRSKINGLKEWSVNCELIWESGNTTGIETVRNAVTNSTTNDLYIEYLPQGVATGNVRYTGKVVVDSFNSSGDLGSLETTSVSLMSDGALTINTLP